MIELFIVKYTLYLDLFLYTFHLELFIQRLLLYSKMLKKIFFSKKKTKCLQTLKSTHNTSAHKRYCLHFIFWVRTRCTYNWKREDFLNRNKIFAYEQKCRAKYRPYFTINRNFYYTVHVVIITYCVSPISTRFPIPKIFLYKIIKYI